MWTKLRISSLLSVGCLGLALSTALSTWSLLAADPPQQPAQAPAQKIRAKELHAKYPFVDIRSRLKYELQAAPPVLSAEADQRLTASESELAERLHFRPKVEDQFDPEQRLGDDQWGEDLRARLRRRTLATVHRHREEDFITAEGFGMERVGPMLKTKYLELPTPGSLPFAKVERPEGAAPATVSTPAGVDDDNPFRIPSRARLAQWHAQGELGFLNIGGLGIKPADARWGQGDQEDRRVAGFESHRFRSNPEFVDGGPLTLSKPRVWARPKKLDLDKAEDVANQAIQAAQPVGERWLIERLELVSLLKHKTPAVYVSKELPAMEALAKTPTRQPSAFETQAVEKLRGGEDLVVESRAHAVRMVGSIRARQQCLECHQTERGALLGAFSYDLAREARDVK